MSSIPDLVLTNAGATLLAKTPIGSPVPVTKWQIGTGILSDGTNLRTRTKLVSVFTEVPIGRIVPSGKECLVTGTYINKGFGAFTWSETGLFAQDPDVGEILYAYGNSGSSGGAPIPAGSAQYREIEFGVQMVFDVSANVTATVSESLIYATRADLKTKADLVGGQVPYAQTPHVAAVKTVYVDAKNGDDSNQGSAEKPFKTIQAAVDSMPRDLGQSGVYISVAEGTYDEDVVLNGFYGGKAGRGIDITGSANRENVSAYRVRSITASNNSTFVKVSGFLITGEAATASVVVSGSILGLLDCTIQKAEDTNVDTGVVVGAGVPAQAKMIRCTVDGYPGSGVLVDGAAVLTFADGTIKNCAKGLVAGSLTSRTGGIATYYSTTFQGNTTDRAVTAGGQIFTTGGFAS